MQCFPMRLLRQDEWLEISGVDMNGNGMIETGADRFKIFFDYEDFLPEK